MTQSQAQQKRLGQYPEFQAFLDFLGSLPESQHDQAWEQMYGLLPKGDLPDSDDWLWEHGGSDSYE